MFSDDNNLEGIDHDYENVRCKQQSSRSRTGRSGSRTDLMRWAKRYNLPFSMPTKFPMKTSPALRGALAMRRFGREWDFMERVFAAYWEKNDGSVGEVPGLRPIVAELGVDQAAFEKLVESDEIRNELIAETDRGLERGVFGVPTFFVGDEMFWGKDRIEFVDDELTTPSLPRVRRSPSTLGV
jgi:2-hydroxychromene-2-carboxylate isomerase